MFQFGEGKLVRKTNDSSCEDYTDDDEFLNLDDDDEDGQDDDDPSSIFIDGVNVHTITVGDTDAEEEEPQIIEDEDDEDNFDSGTPDVGSKSMQPPPKQDCPTPTVPASNKNSSSVKKNVPTCKNPGLSAKKGKCSSSKDVGPQSKVAPQKQGTAPVKGKRKSNNAYLSSVSNIICIC